MKQSAEIGFRRHYGATSFPIKSAVTITPAGRTKALDLPKTKYFQMEERQDLGRVKMATGPRPPYPVETLTIKLARSSSKPGNVRHSQDLHIMRENTDVYVSIASQHPLGYKAANKEATATSI